ncbi:hypothetical protein KDA23_07240 [Candidatus Saccharibacteria bacterium]|nr:hypothetical protein [Candidatus Saccharibacteria bacterium]
MPQAQTQTLAGTVDQTMPLQPVVTTGVGQDRGIPLLINSESREPMAFDPWNLRDDKETDSNVFGVMAKKGHGKTTLNIAISTRLGQRRAGKNSERKIRITIDDHRRDDGTPEYEALTKWYDAEQINLAEFGLNILDPEMLMTLSQQLGLLKSVLGYVFGIPRFSPIMSEALRYGLKKVLENYPKTADLRVMALGLRTLNSKEVARFRTESYMEAQQRHTDNPNFQAEVQRLKSGAGRFNEAGKLYRAAGKLASMIEDLLDGEYGEILGSSGSLAKRMSERVTSFDYSGLNDEQIALLQTVLWHWKTAAIINKDRRFEYDIEVHDENYMMWAFEVYANSMHRYLKQIRSRQTVVIMSTHRPSDYETVGSTDSQQYKQAMNMLHDIAGWFIGRLDRDAAEDIGRRLRLTADEIERIQHLEVGHWAYKIGDNPIVWTELVLVEEEELMALSDSANTSMAIK